MLSRRLRQHSWAYEDVHHGEHVSLFRMLTRRWRPVVAELRQPEGADGRTSQGTKHKPVPTYWSPWLLIK